MIETTLDSEMQRLLAIAKNVATSRATVLICGESGTGKELLARYIHENSSRKNRRLVAVNCAAVPDGLLESELFGHEKGAFTGAQASKPGKFELAHESTFLLDELGELPLLLQAKLLRVIQEGEVERLGAKAPVKVNVRLIATTNRDLQEMVKAGQFREDLYYRLNVIPLSIPPLRDRPSDIKQIATAFLQQAVKLNARSEQRFSLQALDKLISWAWPGNVRELQNVVERSSLLATNVELSPEDIHIEGFKRIQDPEKLRPGMTIDEAERKLILKTLEHTSFNRTQAAKLLGISIRTLRNKLHEYENSAEGSTLGRSL